MDRKPNIIFFFSDQQRWDTAGCYGQRMPVTPNLDRMAEAGGCFENAFTCQPVCGPARACLQTGRYATELGCYRNNIALPQGEMTLAHYLKEAGYRSGYVGKWHLASTGGDSNEPLEPGVEYVCRGVPKERRGGYDDYWVVSDVLEATSHGYGGFLFDAENRRVEFEGYRTDGVTGFALDYMRTWDKNQPYFLFLSHIEPHHQNDHRRFEGPKGSKEQFAGFDAPKDLASAPGDWGSDWQTQYPDYLGCCSRLDYNLGRVLACVKEIGLEDDTVIIYASDHGSHFKTRTVEYKRSCHDGSIHIPLVIYGKDASGTSFLGGKRERGLVSLIDLPSTILTMAGVTVPECMKGRPIQELLDEKKREKWQNEVFLQISESQVGRCIRTERWKYSVRAYDRKPWLDAGADTYREEYLYDLEQDPDELVNLVCSPEHEAVRTEMKTRLIRRMAEAGEREPVILPSFGHTTISLGVLAVLEDLVCHPFTSEMMKELLPEGMVESEGWERVRKMRVKEAAETVLTLGGQEFTDRLLEEMEKLEFGWRQETGE